MYQSALCNRQRMAVGLAALTLTLCSAVPLRTNAAGSPDIAQPASVLGVHEPSAQQRRAHRHVIIPETGWVIERLMLCPS